MLTIVNNAIKRNGHSICSNLKNRIERQQRPTPAAVTASGYGFAVSLTSRFNSLPPLSAMFISIQGMCHNDDDDRENSSPKKLQLAREVKIWPILQVAVRFRTVSAASCSYLHKLTVRDAIVSYI